MIVMEKADSTLFSLISKRRAAAQPFSSRELMEFWEKIVSVFAYCAVFNISHNDIKPSNILLVKHTGMNPSRDRENELNELYTPKISDFGTSMQFQEQDSNVRLLNAEAMFTNS